MKQSQKMLERILAKHLLRIPDEVWTDLRALQTQLDEDIGYLQDEVEELQEVCNSAHNCLVAMAHVKIGGA